jgi:hypothetical protein
LSQEDRTRLEHFLKTCQAQSEEKPEAKTSG